MLRAAAIFSWVASRVIETGHAPDGSSAPSPRLSLWISPFGEAA